MPDRTSTLAGVLLLAFFVFITTRGQLLDYLGVIGLGPRADQWKHPKQEDSSSGGSSDAGSQVSSFVMDQAMDPSNWADIAAALA